MFSYACAKINMDRYLTMGSSLNSLILILVLELNRVICSIVSINTICVVSRNNVIL